MQVVNLTPHALTLRDADGVDHTFQPAAPKGGEARVAEAPSVTFEVPGLGLKVPGVVSARKGEVVGLPDPVPGTLYLVSGMVLSELAGTRGDVAAPGTGPGDNPVRNEKGQVVAVTCLKFGCLPC